MWFFISLSDHGIIEIADSVVHAGVFASILFIASLGHNLIRIKDMMTISTSFQHSIHCSFFYEIISSTQSWAFPLFIFTRAQLGGYTVRSPSSPAQ